MLHDITVMNLRVWNQEESAYPANFELVPAKFGFSIWRILMEEVDIIWYQVEFF